VDRPTPPSYPNTLLALTDSKQFVPSSHMHMCEQLLAGCTCVLFSSSCHLLHKWRCVKRNVCF
jgi:hypothetical protein